MLEFSSRDFDWSEYGATVHSAVMRAWLRRLYWALASFEQWARENRPDLDHENRIDFVIERRGDLTGIRLVGGSGCTPLDESALAALEEVVLPPLPDDFPRDSELVRATFHVRGPIFGVQLRREYVGDSAGRTRAVDDAVVAPVMRQYLNYLREAGYFSDRATDEPVSPNTRP
jgi:hypothetical protein